MAVIIIIVVIPAARCFGALSGISRFRLIDGCAGPSGGPRRGRRHGRRPGGAFNDFVQFTPVKPDAPALRAIVNLDPTTIGHHQSLIVHWASHRALLYISEQMVCNFPSARLASVLASLKSKE
jgi:hypothetical protein